MTIILDVLLLEIVQLGILLGEVYIAKRVYHAIQGKAEFRKWLVQLRLMSTAFTSQEQQHSLPDVEGTTPQRMAAWMMLQGRTPHPPRILWRKIAKATYLASVFIAIYLAVNFLLHPIVNSWALGLIPLCLPLIITPVPYLLDIEPSSALIILIAGLGLGFLALVML
jgi:hypothetical protein